MSCENRLFNISPKTPFRSIEFVRTWNSDLKRSIGADITRNGRELVPGAERAFEVVLGRIRRTHPSSLLHGQAAIDYAVSSTIGSIARGLGCDMHSPPIVYVCGSFFVSEAGGQLTDINERLRQIESGERQLKTNEVRLMELGIAEEVRSHVLNFRQIMSIRIQDYARYTLPKPDEYTIILDELLFKLTAKDRFVLRGRMSEFSECINKGQFEQAMLLLK